MITNNPNTHYLDYYSDWLTAYKNASSFYELVNTKPLCDRFANIMQEWLDAKRVDILLARQYDQEIKKLLDQKLKTFLN